MDRCINCEKEAEAGLYLKQDFSIEIGQSKGSKLFRKEILIKITSNSVIYDILLHLFFFFIC